MEQTSLENKKNTATKLIEEIEHLLRSANFNSEIDLEIGTEPQEDPRYTDELHICWMQEGFNNTSVDNTSVDNTGEMKDYHLYLDVYTSNQDGGDEDVTSEKLEDIYAYDYIEGLKAFKEKVLELIDELL